MTDDPRRRLVQQAGLDDAAAATVDALPQATARRLTAAWDGAVAQQDADLRAAIDGGLSLLPRPLRSRVTRVLTPRDS